MSQSALVDERTFESAVELSAEQQEDNVQHFKGKGQDVEVTLSKPDDATPASASEQKPPETTAPAVTEATPPADSAVTDAPAEHALDAESRADWQSANTDGEKLGKYAKRTKQLNELKATLSAKDLKIAELEGKLAGKPAETPAPSAFAPPAPVVTPEAPKPAVAAPATPEPEIKAKQFEKPRPTLPKFDDFKDEADPYAAFAAAGVKHAEDLVDWNEEKRSFDDEQRSLVAAQKREVEEKRTREQQAQGTVAQRFEEARRAHPDFDTATSAARLTPIMRYLLVERLKDGLELGYQLCKPEHAEWLNEIFANTQETQDQVKIQTQIDEAIASLGAFRRALKKPPVQSGQESTPAPAPPAASNGHAANGNGNQPQQTPPPTPPRREEAAPTPVKGHGTGAPRLEDIDPEDYDARRRFRQQHGLH